MKIVCENCNGLGKVAHRIARGKLGWGWFEAVCDVYKGAGRLLITYDTSTDDPAQRGGQEE
jgi:hypothetical protein